MKLVANKKKESTWGNMLVLTLGMAMFLFSAYQLMQEYRQNLETLHWPQVEATVLGTLVQETSGKSGTSYCYDLHISYTYLNILYMIRIYKSVDTDATLR